MNAPGYRRHVGLFSAIMLIAGSMIGSGVFSASPAAIREAGSTHHRQPLPLEPA
jgi:hypothetical protein